MLAILSAYLASASANLAEDVFPGIAAFAVPLEVVAELILSWSIMYNMFGWTMEERDGGARTAFRISVAVVY
jgi:hypothetical protein